MITSGSKQSHGFGIYVLYFVHCCSDFSGISKTMGTLWHQLPEKEKLFWYSKQRMQIVKHKNVPSLSKQKLRRSSSSGKGSRSPRGSPVRHFSLRTEPIDCAAHLKLLGESLSLVGDRLQNHVVGADKNCYLLFFILACNISFSQSYQFT